MHSYDMYPCRATSRIQIKVLILVKSHGTGRKYPIFVHGFYEMLMREYPQKSMCCNMSGASDEAILRRRCFCLSYRLSLVVRLNNLFPSFAQREDRVISCIVIVHLSASSMSRDHRQVTLRVTWYSTAVRIRAPDTPLWGNACKSEVLYRVAYEMIQCFT
jgi:hypothetical protein